MRRPEPLRRVRSIKRKIALLIVIATATTAFVSQVGLHFGLPVWSRALASCAISLALVEFLAHGLTSPLREMERATTRMARNDYGVRVTARSADEVGRLATAFNVMAAELAEVDRQRRDLVANASYELRTPITALQATLANLVDGVVPTTPATLATMRSQVERLASLVHDLLDLSRLEAGVAPLHIGPVAIVDLVGVVVDDVRATLPALDVRVTSQRDDLKAQADPERIGQVLTILLTNAARYSARIEVAVDESADGVSVAVVDDGPGIPPGEEGRIFERFYRADRARNESGSGLGLAISRWIVEHHGGRIRAERIDPHGCRMVVELPSP